MERLVTDMTETEILFDLLEKGISPAHAVSACEKRLTDAGFEVMDHIRVSLAGNEKLAEIVKKNRDAIAAKVLADEILTDTSLAVSKEWNVNGEKVTIGVEKVNS